MCIVLYYAITALREQMLVDDCNVQLHMYKAYLAADQLLCVLCRIRQLQIYVKCLLMIAMCNCTCIHVI